MGMLDVVLGQLGNIDVAGLAQRVGLSPEQVEQALAALGRKQAEPGDTVADAAAETGLPQDKLQQLLAQIGGEGALGKLAGLVGGEGGLAGGLGGAMGGLSGMFGKS